MENKITIWYETERLENFGRGPEGEKWVREFALNTPDRDKAIKYRDEANRINPGAWRIIEKVEQEQGVIEVRHEWVTTSREVLP